VIRNASATPDQPEAIVIGGGPAGATAAALLAEHGRAVTLLERDPFPRYHVGESLLPFCYHTLDRLGMVQRLNASPFVRKHSVQFASIDGRVSQPFYFTDHLDGHPAGQTWQVERSAFDRMLLDRARERGATVRTNVNARQLITDEAGAIRGVEIDTEDGRREQLHAPLTIDCSGRDGFAINRLGWRVRDPQLSKIALWTYYRGGKRGTGRDEGATTVAYLPEKGWFWHIPLHGDRISLGIVGERDYLYRDGKDLPAIFERELQVNRWVANVMEGAEQFGEFWATGDYSYRSKHSAADGLVLAGDAFAFLDPVFSSGVFLALKSGEMVADAAHAALSRGDVSARAFEQYSEALCAAIEAMRKLVYAFYHEDFNFGKLLKKYPELRGDLTDCLIGHLFKDFDPLFGAVAEFVEVPQELPHGRPLVLAANERQ